MCILTTQPPTSGLYLQNLKHSYQVIELQNNATLVY
jgi:hypothetical protein